MEIKQKYILFRRPRHGINPLAYSTPHIAENFYNHTQALLNSQHPLVTESHQTAEITGFDLPKFGQSQGRILVNLLLALS